MLMAKSETQNMTMVILRRRRGWVLELVLHRPVTSAGSEPRDAEPRSILAVPNRPDEPVDVKRAKQEDEGVNRTEDRERDHRLARRQERRHSIRCSQNPIDYPRLTADLSGEPAGNDGNEGQRKAQES